MQQTDSAGVTHGPGSYAESACGYSPPVQVGLFAPSSTPGTTPDSLRALGAAAEERGFHSVWVPEHVIAFDRESSGPRPPVLGGRSGVLDPFVTLGFLGREHDDAASRHGGHADLTAPAAVRGEGGGDGRLPLGRPPRPRRRRRVDPAGVRGPPAPTGGSGPARRPQPRDHAHALGRRCVRVPRTGLRARAHRARSRSRCNSRTRRSTSAVTATPRCRTSRATGRAGTRSTSTPRSSRNEREHSNT